MNSFAELFCLSFLGFYAALLLALILAHLFKRGRRLRFAEKDRPPFSQTPTPLISPTSRSRSLL